MIKRYLNTFIFTSIIACANPSETKQSISEENQMNEVYIENIDSISGQGLEKILKIPIRSNFNQTYIGFYSYKLDSTKNKILSNDFEFTHTDTNNKDYNSSTGNSIEDMPSTKSIIKYTGSFENGLKTGVFTEELLWDDGVDFYAKWIVKLEYKMGVCVKETFSGVNGFVMPETTYEFSPNDTSTFQSVVDKAWDKWSNEYKIKKTP
jgi:hypothetical protein